MWLKTIYLQLMKLAAHLFLYARKMTYTNLGFLDRKILRAKNPIVILSYHSVATDTWRFSVNEQTIKKQITYLKKNFDIISLKTLVAYLQGKHAITKPSVVLTFDDGYKDIVKLKPFFKEQKITPTLFVLSNPKNPNLKEMGTKREFLTIKDIQSLKKEGWEIGSHSATHANLTTISRQQLEEEVVGSKRELEDKLGFPINYFAYPRGKYNKNVVRLVKKAKYLLGLTMDDGIITIHNNFLTLPRVGIDRTHSFEEFTTTFSPSVVRLRGFIKRSPAGKYL